MGDRLFFFLALSFMLAHEMDAIRCREWRIIPGLSYLPDAKGFRLFILAHVPLYYVMLWAVIAGPDRAEVMVGLDIFFIVHLALHLLYTRSSANKFRGWISWSLIVGAALFGAVDLLLTAGG